MSPTGTAVVTPNGLGAAPSAGSNSTPGAQPGSNSAPQNGTQPATGSAQAATGAVDEQNYVEVSGNVSLFDVPAAGALVNVYRAGGNTLLATVKTDADGNFTAPVPSSTADGSPVRMVALIGQSQALVGMGQAAVVAAGAGNYRIAQVKPKAQKKNARPVTASTTLAMKMNPSYELLLAATFTGKTTISQEAQDGLLESLDLLTDACEDALDILNRGSTDLNPEQSRLALDFVLTSFLPANKDVEGMKTLPPNVVQTLLNGSQAAAEEASTSPKYVKPRYSKLEMAFAEAVQEIAGLVADILEIAAQFEVTIEPVTFAEQTQPPIKVKPKVPTVSIGVNITKTEAGTFQRAPGGPAIANPNTP